MSTADMIAWLRREQEFELSPEGHDYTDNEIADALEELSKHAEVVRED